MKKTVAFIIAILVLCFSAVPCMAQSVSVPGDSEIDVFAHYTEEIAGVYSGAIKDGKTEITLPNGTKITVNGITGKAVKLFVMPIPKSDAEAWKWFEDCIKEIGNNILPFDIYLVDSDGNRIEANENMTIEITLPNGYNLPVVCYLSTSGEATVIDSSTNNGKLSFTANHNGYYVVAQKNGSGGDNGGSPQTGDDSNMMLWLALMTISGAAITVIGISRKKCKAVEK